MKLRFLTILIFQLLLTKTEVWCQENVVQRIYVADTFRLSGKYEEALSELRQTLLYAVTDSIQGEILMRLGVCKAQLNDTDSAIDFFQKAYLKWKSINNQVKVCRSLHNMGDLYRATKNDSSALANYKEALLQARLLSDSIKIHMSMSVLYFDNKEYDSLYNVITHHLISYRNEQIAGLNFYIENGLGVYFIYKKQFNKALFHLKNAATGDVPDLRYLANVYTNIADVYQNMNDISTALKYIDSSMLLCGESS